MKSACKRAVRWRSIYLSPLLLTRPLAVLNICRWQGSGRAQALLESQLDGRQHLDRPRSRIRNETAVSVCLCDDPDQLGPSSLLPLTL